MSGKEILADTNVLIYLLKGDDTINALLKGKQLYISFITELELIGFKNLSSKEEKQIHNLLADCSIIPINESIKTEYIKLRKKYNLKLADSIIAATA